MDALSIAYSTKLAIDLIQGDQRPFGRIIEDVQIDQGECRRRITIDWHLPKLTDALPETLAGMGRLREVVVPALVADRDRLINSFKAESANGENLYVCDQKEWEERTSAALSTLWSPIEDAAAKTSDKRREKVAAVKSDFLSLPSLPEETAMIVASSVRTGLHESKLSIPDALLERVAALGRYVAERHIVWVRVPHRPGDRIRLTLSYRTGFFAGYPRQRSDDASSRPKPRRQRVFDFVRRAVGQEPFQLAIPTPLSTLSRSYHFQLAAPPNTYVAEQRFVLEQNLHESTERQLTEFASFRGGDSQVRDQGAGGPVAHLYARDLPVRARNRVYAYLRISERPPGSTALAMWLAIMTAGFMWFTFVIWPWLIPGDSSDIDLAAFFVALPGLTSIWFSRAFQRTFQSRVPLVSSAGLALVGVAAFYSVLAIIVRRGACSDDEKCPALLTGTFSQWPLLAIAIALTLLSFWLVVRRVKFYRQYWRLQNIVTKRPAR